MWNEMKNKIDTTRKGVFDKLHETRKDMTRIIRKSDNSPISNNSFVVRELTFDVFANLTHKIGVITNFRHDMIMDMEREVESW